MNLTRRGFRTISLAAMLLMMVNIAGTEEASMSLPINHKLSIPKDEENFKPSVNNTLLKMEARINVEDGLDLMKFESKENPEKPDTPPLTKSPQIIARNGVSYVTAISEPRISSQSPSSGKQRKGEVSEGDEFGDSVIPADLPEDRGLRTTKISGKDSYLDALAHSHTSNDRNEGIVHSDVKPKVPKIFRRDYQEGPVYRPDSERYGPPNKIPASGYGIPDYESPSAPAPTQSAFFPTPSNSYSLPEHSFDGFGPSSGYGGSQPSYGTPQPSYATPQPTYGTPQASYGAPQIQHNNYGPPSSSYGGPIQQNGYVPPSNSYLPPQNPQQGYGPPAPTYGAPYALPGMPSLPSLPMIDFTWPFALKLNAFTVAKILLKLVIFKMIVKFIAVICLLLFIPKLEIKKDDDKRDEEDEGRGMMSSNGVTDRLDFLTSMVMGAIENQDKKNRINRGPKNNCTSFSCRLMKTLTSGESWSDYIRLLKSYVVEERQKLVEKERAEHRTKNS